MRRLDHAIPCRSRVAETVSRQVRVLLFCSMGKMKMSLGDGDEWSWRRKDPSSRGDSGVHSDSVSGFSFLVGADEGSSELSSTSAGGDTRYGEHNSRIMMIGDIPVHLEATPNYPLNCNESPGTQGAAQERDIGTDSQKSPKHCEIRAAPEVVRKVELASYDTGTHRGSDGVVNFIKRRTRVDLRNQGTTRSDSSIKVEKLHTSIGLKDARSLSASIFVNKAKPFDICLPRRRRLDFAETSDPVEDCEQTHEAVQLVEQESRVLRPGMVLLKNYVTLREQIDIIRKCREIGIGPGGFYQPCYQDGAKLRLQMMCLGLDWDPNTRKYERQRRVDGCSAPDIPNEFILAVKRAIGDAKDLVKKGDRRSNLRNDLPTMSPNICIVNFYTTTGRLGLHQDRDESRESLRKGLPVVSFSIGDSAEFLFRDYRDADGAERVMLESGDVVIFGGESRMVFHGISSVVPNSAPKALVDKSGLRPGRLNLTFRQF
ncbi:uncharacterized protein LOC115746933 isoform X2 [Rhodamnia argentea]|uniref:Uncharacterized protein LOC115746933 isoform X2 n=1 Tax=Rhodamnia argentea TaxID=178133 RepID=A0A8B8PVH5_9MYRT|nr:uncharacterized protein LOC115746933 isoform X2 [Rhodamnia argentea]